MSALNPVKMSSSGTSSIVLVNPVANISAPYSFPPSWSLGIICTLSSGGNLTYSVQITGDQVPSANGNWNNHDTLTSQVGSANGNVAFPITGLRLNVSSFVSGTINMAVVIWP